MVVMNAGHANVFTGRAGREACVTTGGGHRQTEPCRRLCLSQSRFFLLLHPLLKDG